MILIDEFDTAKARWQVGVEPIENMVMNTESLWEAMVDGVEGGSKLPERGREDKYRILFVIRRHGCI